MSNEPNWTYKNGPNGVKLLLYKGRVATRKGVRRGTRGGKGGAKRVTLPGTVNSKAGRISYKKIRDKAINLGVPVVSNEKKAMAKAPVDLRMKREDIINAILKKNLPKFQPKEKMPPRRPKTTKAKKAKKAATGPSPAALTAAIEAANAANAAAAKANARVASLQAELARATKRKAVEETNANKNRAVKRVKIARALKRLGMNQAQINARLRNQGLL